MHYSFRMARLFRIIAQRRRIRSFARLRGHQQVFLSNRVSNRTDYARQGDLRLFFPIYLARLIMLGYCGYIMKRTLLLISAFILLASGCSNKNQGNPAAVTESTTDQSAQATATTAQGAGWYYFSDTGIHPAKKSVGDTIARIPSMDRGGPGVRRCDREQGTVIAYQQAWTDDLRFG